MAQLIDEVVLRKKNLDVQKPFILDQVFER
jgi:hypothetical protein